VNYYTNIVNNLDFNEGYSAYSGAVNECYIDIMPSGCLWSCEVSVDGLTTQAFGAAEALKTAVEGN
jgi:hypothetical protein